MKTWVKLYTEVIDDPKIGRLSLADKGVWMMLLALAGQLDDCDEDGQQTGRLSSLEDVAWHIRCPVEELAPSIERFKAAHMVHDDGGVLVLTHFAERQDALTGAERARHYRRNRGKREYYDTETPAQQLRNEPVTNRYEEENRIDKNREEKMHAADAASPPAPQSKKPKPEKPKCPKEMMDALYTLCKIDVALASPGIRRRVSDCGLALIKSGKSPPDVQAFADRWYRYDWRGTDNKPPTPEQVRDQWQTVISLTRSNGNDRHSNTNHGLGRLPGHYAEYHVADPAEFEPLPKLPDGQG